MMKFLFSFLKFLIHFFAKINFFFNFNNKVSLKINQRNNFNVLIQTYMIELGCVTYNTYNIETYRANVK